MDFTCYRAMTAAEFSFCQKMPAHPAWMACHYACYGNGLSNLPQAIPEGAMLIVNDRTPPHKHDPAIIGEQLLHLIEQFKIGCVLLDFQREGFDENIAVTQQLLAVLPCPVGVSEAYAGGLQCPVFVGCPQPHETLHSRIEKWGQREIWLELATETETAVITKEDAIFKSAEGSALTEPAFFDAKLCCRYCTKVLEDRIIFTMLRDSEALQAIRKEAESMGIRVFVGLYQQLGEAFSGSSKVASA